MLTRSGYLELSLPLLDGLADSQQQILGGHTVMPLHCFYLEHFRTPPTLTYLRNTELFGNGFIRGNQRITAADWQRAVADWRHELLELCIKGQHIIDNLLCAAVDVQTFDQAGILRADTHRAFTRIAGVAAALFVTDTAEQLNEYFTDEYAVGTQAHHLECISCRIAGHADAAAAIKRDLPLQALLDSSQIAVKELRDTRMAGMIERNLLGCTRAALNAIDEETTADLIWI